MGSSEFTGSRADIERQERTIEEQLEDEERKMTDGLEDAKTVHGLDAKMPYGRIPSDKRAKIQSAVGGASDVATQHFEKASTAQEGVRAGDATRFTERNAEGAELARDGAERAASAAGDAKVDAAAAKLREASLALGEEGDFLGAIAEKMRQEAEAQAISAEKKADQIAALKLKGAR